MTLLIFLAVVTGLLTLCSGHLRLTFPPARYPALDFLDTFRTPNPCGVEKRPGGRTTALKAGAYVNVTWWMAYPHRGGFSVELINAQGRLVSRLAPRFAGVDDQTYVVLAGRTTALKAGAYVNVTWWMAYPHRGGFSVELINGQGRLVSRLAPRFAGVDDQTYVVLAGRTTALKAGAYVNVTWWMAYPHRGGFSVELINGQGRLVSRLAPRFAGVDDQTYVVLAGRTTALKAGAYVNVTWWMAYPHRGGFSVELINAQGRLVSRLAPRFAGVDDQTYVVLAGRTTALKAGAYVNVTWWMAYPHRGGFSVELINAQGRLVSRLAPRFAGVDDQTLQHRVVMLPPDVSGPDFVLRLVRQAEEWGPDYYFHSCADIDIVADSDTLCGDDGVWNGTACICNYLSRGEFCQFKDECGHAKDCSESHAECMYTHDGDPECHCYCKDGKFGEKCEEGSEGVTPFSPEGFQMRAVDSDNKIYWKILQGSNEIEMVLQYKGSSWVAVGWRPSGIASDCAKRAQAHFSGEDGWSWNGRSDSAWERIKEWVSRQYSLVKRYVKKFRRAIMQSRKLSARTKRYLDEVAKREVAAEPNPKNEPTTEPEPEGESNSNLHLMDCTDIVVGSVKGGAYRIHDYYTPSRATPMMDDYFGGTQGLTAASGFQADGFTHIRFRKKLTVNDKHFDHDIVDGPMQVIWAKGQEFPDYSHRPSILQNTSDISRPQFYTIDVLKYHGSVNRGSFEVNFHDVMGAKVDKNCEGSFKSPPGCRGEACAYGITWMVTGDIVKFNLEAVIPTNKWSGVGFSPEGKMEGADIVTVLVHQMEGADARIVVQDRYSAGYARPVIDVEQGVNVTSSSYANGRLTVQFQRPIMASDQQDVALDSCLYFLFPVGGGPLRNGNIEYHHRSPERSAEKICLQKCTNPRPEPTGETEPEPEVKTTAETEPEPEIKSTAESEPEPEIKSTAETEPEPEIKSTAETEPEPEIKSTAESEPEPEINTTAETETESEFKTTAETEPEPEVNSTAETEPEPEFNTSTEAEPEPETTAMPLDKNCADSFSFPPGCDGDGCFYRISWVVIGGDVQFKLDAQIALNEWSGLGFSAEGRMAGADIVTAIVHTTDSRDAIVTVQDRYASGYSQPVMDVLQGLTVLHASYIEGRMSTHFKRAIAASDTQDVRLDDCVYFLYPTSGGPMKGGSLSYHYLSPQRSVEQICLQKCARFQPEL